MVTYELKLEKFQGPLAKLLELIEARQMPITDISLADVTDDFMRYLRQMAGRGTDMELVADFISVASRLILIKSKILLPDLELTEEEEAGIAELEARLKIYREFRPAMRSLLKLWREGSGEFGRPYLYMKGGAPVFYPGGGTSPAALFEAMRELFEVFKGLELETATLKEKIVTIEEKIEEILKRLTAAGEARFAVMAERQSRSEIIAIFLAILHLAREQSVRLTQKGNFSDIIVSKNN